MSLCSSLRSDGWSPSPEQVVVFGGMRTEAPWAVTEVELDLEDRRHGEVRVHVAGSAEQWPCPECGRLCPGYDHLPRRWRHLDTCQYPTILLAQVPRVQCPDHGVKQVRVPWGEPGSIYFHLGGLDLYPAGISGATHTRP